MPPPISHLGTNIRRAREECGHTQESLARVLGISYRSVGQWEQNATAPTRGNLERLSAELCKTPAWFYTDHDAPVPA